MNRPILIQVAMEVECQKILESISNIEEHNLNNYKVYTGLFNSYEIVILLSKVGLINTSSSLTMAIDKYPPKLVINIGISGSTSPNIHIKDIVVGTSILNINSYRTPFLEKGSGTNPNNWELLTFLSGEEDRILEEKADKLLLKLTEKLSNCSKIFYGKIGSGDCWNREIDRITYLTDKYNILCEDMESIATYTIANNMNIPVISLKCISDNILTGEEYNRNVSIDFQQNILEYISILIDNIDKI